MADMVTAQELENAKIDARTIGESVNENKIVTPRYGAPFKSMPMIAEEMQSAIGAIIAGAVPASIVLDGNQAQDEINLYGGKKYDMPAGGYLVGGLVRLDNGDIVKSTVANNTVNPNINMTGWFVPYMRGSQNLAELTNKAVARTNLDVYSKAETNSIAATPTATELIAGKARLATQTETNTATNDASIITPMKLLAGLKKHLNASGVAPMFACRAWVNFNGSGTVAIRGSGNVSSITDNGVGDYTLNFTIAMPDANHALSGFCNFIAAANAGIVSASSDFAMSASSVRIKAANATTGGAFDATYITVGVFR